MATDQFSLPENVHRRLRSLGTQIRALSSIRGFGIGLTICAGVVACCVLLDWMIELPQWLRFGLLGAFCLTAIACVVRFLIVPLVQRFDATELATLLESGNPELKESVSSAIELNDDSIPNQHRGSQYMREQLNRRTARAAADATPSNSVSPKSSMMSMGMGVLAVFLLAIPFLVWPSSSRLMAARFFQPWKNLDRPTNLYFEVLQGNRVIAHGSDAKIVAIPRWREQEEPRPESVLVNWSYTTDGHTGSKRMQWDAGESAYVAEIRHVVSDFDYNITSDSARSKQYHIQAVTAPTVETLLLDVEPPPYSGLPAEHHDGIIGEVRAFERSNLRFSMTFNKPVRDANFLWRADTSPADVPPQTLPLTLAEDSLSATFEFPAVESGRFRISLRDEVELTNEEDTERELFVIIDRPPLIQFVGGMKSQMARPDAVFEVGVTASDDIGIGEVSLHYFIEDTEVGSIPFETLERGARRSDHVFQLKLAELDIPEGVTFSFKARVADERPIPSPNVSWTEDRSLVLSADADSIDKQELTRQQEELRDRIREIREQVTNDRNEVRKQKGATREAQRKGEDFKDDKKLSEMASEEFKLSEKLEEISQELDKHPLFKELVDRAQDVSRKDMPKASEELGNAARKANLTSKEQALNEAEKSLNNAEWKLRNIEERFTDLADLEQDIADLDQLAKDTEKLAENVEQLEQQKQQAAAQQDEQAKEKALQDIVDKQNELLDKQQDIEQELNELNDKRPELAEAARKAQMEKLKQIAEQARDLANREGHLANSFQNEANENRGQTRSTLRKAREAQRAAEQLQRQMEQKGLKDTVDPAPLKKAVEELQRGNLDSPQKAMSEAARQLGEKSDQLENADKDGQPNGGDQSPTENKEESKSSTENGQSGSQSNGQPESGKNAEQQAGNKDAAEQSGQNESKAADQQARQKLSPEERRKLVDAAKDARKKAEEVANELRQMQEQQQAAAEKKREAGKPQDGDDRKGDNSEQGEQTQEPANGKTDPQEGQSRPTELAKKQRELAQAAEAMARIMEAEKGNRDSGTQQAKQAAQAAKRSADMAEAGLFKDAAKSADQAAERQQNTSQEASKGGDAQAKDLSDKSKQLAQAQKEHAEELEKASEAPDSGREGRREGQKQAAQEMQDLAQQLQEAAEQLNSQPIDMPQQGNRAQEAQQSAQQAQQQAQQASENAAQNSPEKASKAARKAAQELQKAASKAQQASNGKTKQTPVPEDVGEQFAKAMKSVEEAGKELAQQPGTQETGDQQGKKPGDQQEGEKGKGKGEEGQEGEGKGQQGKGQQGEGKKPGQQPGQSGQKQSGQQQQGQGQPSQKLRDAAKQMSDAAKNALPKSGQGQTGDQGQSRVGENTEPGGAPKGESDRLKALLGDRREGRDWGKLPGHLQTEILQGAQKNPNGDYAKLIRMYFKEIAKATEGSKKSPPATEPAGKGNDK